MDPEKRKDIIFQMQQILIDDAAVLIDGYYNSSMITIMQKSDLHISTQQITTGCLLKLYRLNNSKAKGSVHFEQKTNSKTPFADCRCITGNQFYNICTDVHVTG